MKKTFYTEISYALGLILLSIGTAFMELADFGMSMIVAPAYVIYLKIHESLSFFTFGMSQYLFQLALLIVLVILQKRINRFYLFSFITAVLYGLTLDGSMALVGLLPADTLWLRAIWYLVGIVVCAIGVSMLFHTYIPPEAYELFVKEMAPRWNISLSKLKTIYDCVSCVLGILLSFLFWGFGHFEGVKWGTILCALVNGWLIGRSTALLEHFFTFKDALPYRKYFEKG